MATTDTNEITVSSILSCIACSQEFRQCNPKYPLDRPVPIRKIKVHTPGWAQDSTLVSTLLDAVESIISKPIEIEIFDESIAQSVDGMCAEFDDKAIIFINKKHNYCWSRFFAAKELAHLLMNHELEKLRTTDTEIIINTITGLLNPQSFREESIFLQTEIDAYIGAVEMLLPKESLDKLSGATFTDEHISQAMKVPKRIVASRISEKVSAMHDTIYAHPKYENAILHERVKRAGC